MEAKAKQIKIINQANYHYHDIISLKSFKSKESEIDRERVLIKIIDNYERICSVTAPSYWIVSFESGYVKEKGGNKYLIFDNSFAENKDLLKNTQIFGMYLNTRLKK